MKNFINKETLSLFFLQFSCLNWMLSFCSKVLCVFPGQIGSVVFLFNKKQSAPHDHLLFNFVQFFFFFLSLAVYIEHRTCNNKKQKNGGNETVFPAFSSILPLNYAKDALLLLKINLFKNSNLGLEIKTKTLISFYLNF